MPVPFGYACAPADVQAVALLASARTCANFWRVGISPGTERTDRLELLGLRGSRIDLLRYLAVHPGERVHLRRLEQLFGQESASFQRDLRALVELGALRRVHGAPNRVEYELVASWPSWPTIRSLLAELSDPAALVREALRGVKGVEAAFVYGSEATGRARPDSDVDVFVLGDALDRRALYRSLAEVTMLTGRQVHPGLYTRMKLAEGIGRADSPSRRFLRDVLAGPKTWVAGGEDAIRPLAAAAGVFARHR
jgi:predicted nucleotidyltransferase